MNNLLRHTIFLWLIAIIVTAVTVLYFHHISRNPDLAPFDGPFQMLNWLRRVQAGMLPGRDYPVFHGVGLVWIHYPLFLLCGSNLYAALLSMNCVTFGSTSVALFWAMRMRSAGWAACLAAALVLPAIIRVCLGDLVFVQSLIDPGNSQFATRTSVALLCCLFCVSLRRKESGNRWSQAIAIGSVVGVGGWIVSDQFPGMLLTGLLASATAIDKSHGPKKITRRLLLAVGKGAAFLISAGMIYLGILYCTTGGKPLAQLEYSWIYLPGDQFWYFGAPPNPFVSSFRDIPLSYYGWMLTGVCMCLAGWKSKREGGDVGEFFIILAGGIATQIPNLGYFNYSYSAGFLKFGLILALLGTRRNPTSPNLRAFQRINIMIAVGGTLAVLAKEVIFDQPHGDTEKTTQESRRRIVTNDGLPPNPILGCNLDREHRTALQKTIELTGARPASLWSIYSGLAQAYYGVIPKQLDYIIHGIGPLRREYTDQFDSSRPEFVSVPIPKSRSYSGWLMDTTWPLYRSLVENYEPAGDGGYLRFWKRAGHREISSKTTELYARPYSQSTYDINIPALQDDEFQLAECTVFYENHAKYPVIGRLSRNIVTIEDARGAHQFAMPPSSLANGQFTFPLILRDSPAKVRFKTKSPFVVNLLKIGKVEVSFLSGVPQTSIKNLYE